MNPVDEKQTLSLAERPVQRPPHDAAVRCDRGFGARYRRRGYGPRLSAVTWQFLQRQPQLRHGARGGPPSRWR